MINLTSYTIRGYNTGSLCNWVIEGSNNMVKWNEIDRHESCNDLNGLYASKAYHVNTSKKYRYIRLRQIDPDINNENYLTLCCLEFFRSLKISSRAIYRQHNIYKYRGNLLVFDV